jgi:hypothetical protein
VSLVDGAGPGVGVPELSERGRLLAPSAFESQGGFPNLRYLYDKGRGVK